MSNLHLLAKNFPGNISESLETIHLEKSINLPIRIHIKRKFASIFAANDLTKKFSPTRTGILLRNYITGDNLSAISLRHFVKTDQLMTRIDYSSGKASANIILHNYANMQYKHENNESNKLQLALASCALIKEAHNSLFHSCTIHLNNHNYFQPKILSIHKHLKRAKFNYIVSDLLNCSQTNFSAFEEILNSIKTYSIPNPCLIITRDITELPNSFSDKNVLLLGKLLPYNPAFSYKANSIFFSGDDYNKNLINQIEYIKNKCHENNISFILSYNNLETHNYLNELYRYCSKVGKSL